MTNLNTPGDLQYTTKDEWVRRGADRATIGVTDFAQAQLGDIVFVELPKIGDILTQDDVFGVIESVKAVADLYVPISGEVVAVNPNLGEQPELINNDCYGSGWMVELQPTNESEFDELLSAEDYEKCVAERDD